MRLLIVHNRYVHEGGEELVVRNELRLVESAGVDVRLVIRESDAVSRLTAVEKVFLAASLPRRAPGRSLVREGVEQSRSEVVHFHNLYPYFGPGAVEEAAGLGCATVRTLHNYRLTCVAGTHFRAAGVCEACDGTRRVSGVLNGCYRGSRMQSLAMTRACAVDFRLAAEGGLPDVIICLTEFARRRFVAAGLPPDRLVVKPNSVDFGSPMAWSDREGVCFVGRLSPEKGVAELVEGWNAQRVPLIVVGDGPLRERVDVARKEAPAVTVLGARDADGVRAVMRSSRVVVLPSLGFEGLPTVALEAWSEGTPVIAFDHGWFSEFREHFGLPSVRPGDFRGLVDAAVHLADAPRSQWELISEQAVALHAQRFTHDRNLAALLDAYAMALDRAKARLA